jgi:hypothetical protein
MTDLESPYRSPLIVINIIKDIVKNKVVCDLGAACGDLLMEMKPYAKEVKGIELYQDRVNKAQKKGLNVIQGDILLDTIPEADVYYMWVVKHIIWKMLKRISKGTLILGADPAEGEDKVIEELNLKGEWRKIDYNEGNGWRQRGVFKVFITEIKETI